MLTNLKIINNELFFTFNNIDNCIFDKFYNIYNKKKEKIGNLTYGEYLEHTKDIYYLLEKEQ